MTAPYGASYPAGNINEDCVYIQALLYGSSFLLASHGWYPRYSRPRYKLYGIRMPESGSSERSRLTVSTPHVPRLVQGGVRQLDEASLQMYRCTSRRTAYELATENRSSMDSIALARILQEIANGEA